jgi:hypothetical protein
LTIVPPLFFNVAHRQEDAFQVDRNHPVEGDLLLFVQCKAAAADPGIVERDIEPAVSRDGGLDHCGAFLAAADIHLAEQSAAAGLAHQGRRALAFHHVHIGDQYAATLGGKAEARRAADAAGAAGHDDGFAFKTAGHGLPRASGES